MAASTSGWTTTAVTAAMTAERNRTMSAGTRLNIITAVARGMARSHTLMW